MGRLLRALEMALPDTCVRWVGDRVEGYANDRWRVGTDDGKFLVKVTRLPNPPQAHIAFQRQSQRLLTDIGYPTPEMLFLGPSSEFGGRLMSVQRFIPAGPGDAETADGVNVLDTLDADFRVAFFVDFGRAVGRLHSLELPDTVGWLDEDGALRYSWPEIAYPEAALRHLRDDPDETLTATTIDQAARRIERALTQVPDVAPRLVHRDLHVGNTLRTPGGRFAGVIDLDIVRAWDYPWDFAVRLGGVFRYWRCRGPFLQGYHEHMGEPPADFGFRRWLYTGINAIRTASEYIAGNHGVSRPSSVTTWLATPPPG